MKWMTAAIGVMIAATPAVAHVGDHSGMSWTELLEHHLEPVHLPLVIAGILVGLVAFYMSRKAATRRTDDNKDQS